MAGELAVANGARDLALRGVRVPALERDARGDEAEVRAPLGRHPRPERAAAERDRVLGVIEQAELPAKLRQVADDARGRQAIAQAAAELEGALGQLEGVGVLVAPGGDDGEVVERERDGAEVAQALPLRVDLFEDRARLVEGAVREERDAAVQPRAQLRRGVAMRCRGQRVLGEMPVCVVPPGFGEEDLSERVAGLRDRLMRLGAVDGAGRTERALGGLAGGPELALEVSDLGQLGCDERGERRLARGVELARGAAQGDLRGHENLRARPATCRAASSRRRRRASARRQPSPSDAPPRLRPQRAPAPPRRAAARAVRPAGRPRWRRPSARSSRPARQSLRADRAPGPSRRRPRQSRLP